MRPICLLTDFGTADWYAGVLHAVLERHAPGVCRLDLSHGVPAGDVAAAALYLESVWPWLPAEAVVLVVVDPGVGSDRRPLAVRFGARWVVAPDNGLCAALGRCDEARELDPSGWGVPPASATFHGRDLFAPAAARLARGDDPATLGPQVSTRTLVAPSMPRGTARVLHVDRFGNVITSVRAADVGPDARLAWTGGETVARVRTYAEAPPGRSVTLEGSTRYLEIAANRTSAAESTGLRPGDPVRLVE